MQMFLDHMCLKQMLLNQWGSTTYQMALPISSKVVVFLNT